MKKKQKHLRPIRHEFEANYLSVYDYSQHLYPDAKSEDEIDREEYQ